MNLDEIIGEVVEGRGSSMVRQLAAETIRQAGVTAIFFAVPLSQVQRYVC